MIDLAVIMSIYHKDKLCYVKESVQSIVNQTFKDFHYYLIFDGPVSTDVENYVTSLSDKRIHLFRLEKNSGLAVALNTLLKIILKNSEYRFIARMDADDVSLTNRFEHQINYLYHNPQISCVGSWYQEIDGTGSKLSSQQLPVNQDEIKKLLPLRTPLAHSSVVFRTELIKKAGLYRTDVPGMEDYVLWCSSIMNGFLFANIPLYLIQFRRDENFYKRRSGISYGYNFLCTKFRIYKQLKSPLYFYIYLILISLIHFMPPFFIKPVYCFYRKGGLNSFTIL